MKFNVVQHGRLWVGRVASTPRWVSSNTSPITINNARLGPSTPTIYTTPPLMAPFANLARTLTQQAPRCVSKRAAQVARCLANAAMQAKASRAWAGRLVNTLFNTTLYPPKFPSEIWLMCSHRLGYDDERKPNVPQSTKTRRVAFFSVSRHPLKGAFLAGLSEFHQQIHFVLNSGRPTQGHR
jgi:hypothetical protein